MNGCSVTPLPSSQAKEPAQVSPALWTKRAELYVRRKTRDRLAEDPHFRAMKPRARRLMRVLIVFHKPATGHLPIRTKNATLLEMMECSETTLRRARHEAIAAGFIAGYDPGDGGRGVGDGGWAGRYTISRTPQEAAAARALRQAPNAPYWPAIPEREELPSPLMPAYSSRQTAPKKKAPAGKARDVAQAAQQTIPEVLPDGPATRYDPITDDAREANSQNAKAVREALRGYGGPGGNWLAG